MTRRADVQRSSRRRKKAALLRDQWAWQNSRCFYCDVKTWIKEGQKLSEISKDALKTMATIEHLERLADDGSNSADNIVVACHECNSRRAAIPWQEYLDRKETLSRANCADPEDGYGLTIRPTGPTPDFRVRDTYFVVNANRKRKRR